MHRSSRGQFNLSGKPKKYTHFMNHHPTEDKPYCHDCYARKHGTACDQSKYSKMDESHNLKSL